jgi:starch synthase
LIIKVASIPKERMQVYFIDNEEYFKRRAILRDENQKLFKDNDERIIFFTKGVIETVKKLNWSPDIIHLHGWFTCLFPLYLNTYYKDEPIFAHSKIVTSVYAQDFEGVLSDQFHKKVSFDGISDELIEPLKNATFQNLEQLCLNFSDGYVMGDVETPDFIQKYSNENEIPGLNYQESQNEDALVKFYNNIILK